MLFLIASGLLSLLLSLLLTPLCRTLLRRLNLVDVADSERKIHEGSVPCMGGIAVFAAYVGSLAVYGAMAYRMPPGIPHSLDVVLKLLPATTIVFMTGILDDVRQLKPWKKLAGQLAASAVAAAMGIRIGVPGDHAAQSWIGILLTILWLLLCTNAFNLIDGVDGLASGAGLFAALSMFATAMLRGNYGLAAASIPLAGALLGFLRYNFSPASIFLGDCGSLVIGFMLGCFAIVWGQKSATALDMAAPVTALALPLLDTALAIIRRFVGDRPIFGADRGHIHHRLLDRGHTPRVVTLRLYLMCGAAAVLSLLPAMIPGHGFLFFAISGACIVLGVRSLDYVELKVARRAVMTGTFRKVMRAEICLHQLETELRKVATCDAVWTVLQKFCAETGISGLEWQCGERVFRYSARSSSPGYWRTIIPFSPNAYVSFDREETPGDCFLIARMVRILRTYLPEERVLADLSASRNHLARRAAPNATVHKAEETFDPPQAAPRVNDEGDLQLVSHG